MTEGEKFLAGLTTEQLRSVATAMHSQIDAATNKGYADEAAAQWFARHPEVAFQGQAGYDNGLRMQTWLKQQGKNPPYSSYDMDNAYAALEELGVIHMNEEKRPQAAAEDEHDSFLDTMVRRQRIV